MRAPYFRPYLLRSSQVKCEVTPGGVCVSGAGQRTSGELQAGESPPGQRRPHREAEGGGRPAKQGESSVMRCETSSVVLPVWISHVSAQWSPLQAPSGC